MKHALTICAALILAGCASVAPYQPLHKGIGYSEQKLESNRYRISFAGNTATPRATVENYVLYRAAEITLMNSYDGFTLVSRDTQAERKGGGPSIGFGLGGISLGSNVGLGIGLGTGGSSATEYQGSADIVLFKGKKVEADTRAYDARELKANLEASIQRPKP